MGDSKRLAHVLSDQENRQAASIQLAESLKISCTRTCAKPIDGSSKSSSFGLAKSARAIASHKSGLMPQSDSLPKARERPPVHASRWRKSPGETQQQTEHTVVILALHSHQDIFQQRHFFEYADILKKSRATPARVIL